MQLKYATEYVDFYMGLPHMVIIMYAQLTLNFSVEAAYLQCTKQFLEAAIELNLYYIYNVGKRRSTH